MGAHPLSQEPSTAHSGAITDKPKVLGRKQDDALARRDMATPLHSLQVRFRVKDDKIVVELR